MTPTDYQTGENSSPRLQNITILLGDYILNWAGFSTLANSNVRGAMLDLTYPKILELFREHLDPKRTESASFLIWYFENYLRLEQVDAIDAICDQSGDKGVDGIYINEDANIVEIYQSKISQKAGSTIGDTLLKEFAGTLSQFETKESLENLVRTAGSAEIAKLIGRLDLHRRLPELEVRGVFICNSEIDANGSAYLAAYPKIRFIGKNELDVTYIPPERTLPIATSADFDVSGFDTATYVVDSDHQAILAPIKASELIALQGISNQTLFAYNVRGSLGRTQVNRDITDSIKDASRHKIFPLFHNGITIIASGVSTTADKITVNDYFVVNGCQSLTALYNNRPHITGDLRVLTRIVKASPSSDLAAMVTRFSNNQNGVKARDFKSNNRIQIRLQNEMSTSYGTEFFFEIKRGEDPNGLEVISNETAGLYIMAFDLKQPWGTHRKYQVFEDLHADLFGRPAVSAHRIVLYHLLNKEVLDAIGKLKNTLISKYALTRYLLLYILRLILEQDDLGQKTIDEPKPYLTDIKKRVALLVSVGSVLEEIVTDLNAELDQLPEDFDYRGRLRDEKWANKLAYDILATHQKLVARKRMESFKELYEKNVGASSK